MNEIFKSTKSANREVVFFNRLAEFIRVTIDDKTNIQTLIQEREKLGETVEIITNSGHAAQIVNSRNSQYNHQNSDTESQWKRS